MYGTHMIRFNSSYRLILIQVYSIYNFVLGSSFPKTIVLKFNLRKKVKSEIIEK